MHIMSPGAASNGDHPSDQGQQDRPESSLSATAETSGTGPVMTRIRQSPYTIEEVSLMLDGLYLLAFLTLIYLEVRE